MNNIPNEDYGTYVVQSFEYKDWATVLNLNRPIANNETFTGTSSYFAKLNVFLITRQNFLEYLHFFASYDDSYQQMHGEYQRICIMVSDLASEEVKRITVKEPEKYKEIKEIYEKVIQRNYSEIKSSTIIPLKDVYITFFKNYKYFRDFRIGYSFYMQPELKKYYANVVGSTYPINPTTESLYCVELDTNQSIENNFRLYPLIPTNINIDEPKLELAIFGNGKWVSPIQFAFPYHNTQKPNYKYTVNSITISLSIAELNKPIIELKEQNMKVVSYYVNSRLYPASDVPEVKVFLRLIREITPNEQMRGVPLFNSGIEWIEKPF